MKNHHPTVDETLGTKVLNVAANLLTTMTILRVVVDILRARCDVFVRDAGCKVLIVVGSLVVMRHLHLYPSVFCDPKVIIYLI